jgi:hypothetical protein
MGEGQAAHQNEMSRRDFSKRLMVKRVTRCVALRGGALRSVALRRVMLRRDASRSDAKQSDALHAAGLSRNDVARKGHGMVGRTLQRIEENHGPRQWSTLRKSPLSISGEYRISATRRFVVRQTAKVSQEMFIASHNFSFAVALRRVKRQSSVRHGVPLNQSDTDRSRPQRVVQAAMGFSPMISD